MKAAFADNCVWTSAGENWEPLPAPEVVGDAELAKQYRLRYGDRARYKPVRSRGVWICACGGINGEGEERCHLCGNWLDELLGCDWDGLTAERDRRLAEEKAAAEANAAADKAAKEAAAKKTKKLLAVAIPTAAACIAAVLLITKVVIPNSNYNKAKALLDAGQYPEAIAAFEALNGYKDSAEQLTAAKAAKVEADRLAEQARIEVERLAEEARIEAEKAAAYENAAALADAGQTYEAATSFYALGDYGDARERSFAIWAEIAPRETVAARELGAIGLRADGTVLAVGKELDVSGWKNVVSVAAGKTHTVGLCANSTVLAAGNNDYSQCGVFDWTDVVSVAAGNYYTMGLRADGTVLIVGWKLFGLSAVSDWTDIMLPNQTP